jgi:hypothetical protein
VIRALVLCAMLVGALAVPVYAAGPFYVDAANGNDAAAGTSWLTAWRTLAKADSAAVVLAGGVSTLYITGTFTETLDVPKDSLAYDGGGAAIIDASDRLAGWKGLSSTVFMHLRAVDDSSYQVWFGENAGTRVYRQSDLTSNRRWRIGVNGSGADSVLVYLSSAADTASVYRSNRYGVIITSRAEVTVRGVQVRRSRGSNGTCGAFHVTGTSANTLIERCESAFAGQGGVYVYTTTTGTTVRNCVLRRGVYGVLHYGQTARYLNCTIADGTAGISVTSNAPTIRNCAVVNHSWYAMNFNGTVTYTGSTNLYWPQGSGMFLWHGVNVGSVRALADSSGQEAGSMLTDPLFTADYHIPGNSPARNAGTPVGLTADYDGLPIRGLPDIGAHEYQPKNIMPVLLPLLR